MKANFRTNLILAASNILLLSGMGSMLTAEAATPAAAPAAGAAVNTQDPTQLIQDVASGILKELDADRAA